MPNAYDFLGADFDFFMKSSWNVFCDLNGVRQYVGKTTNEKTTSPNLLVLNQKFKVLLFAIEKLEPKET